MLPILALRNFHDCDIIRRRELRWICGGGLKSLRRRRDEGIQIIAKEFQSVRLLSGRSVLVSGSVASSVRLSIGGHTDG